MATQKPDHVQQEQQHQDDNPLSPSFLLAPLFSSSKKNQPQATPSVVVLPPTASCALQQQQQQLQLQQQQHNKLRTSNESDFSHGGESIFTPSDPFAPPPGSNSFSGSLSELPAIKAMSPALFQSLTSLPSVVSISSMPSADSSTDSVSLRPSVSANASTTGSSSNSFKPSSSTLHPPGPARRPTLFPGGGRRPSAATFVAPPPVDLATVCARPINPATGAPETALEARERRRSSKKPQQVARLRATFSKFPKFSAPNHAKDPPAAAAAAATATTVTTPSKPISRLRGSARPQLHSPLSESDSFVRYKSNSMASIFDTAATLSTPDNEEVVRCIAVALRYHIKRGHHGHQDPSPSVPPPAASSSMDIFDERLHPVTQSVRRDSYWHKAPPLDDVYRFVSTIFNAEKLAPECAILSLAYTERLLETGKVQLCSTNWRRLILSCIILASKVWEDQAVWNVDFVNVFPRLSVADLNRMEKIVLALLQYNVSLHASLYAKYYFELRDLSDLDDGVFPLQPVDPRSAVAAQTRVETTQRRKGHQRTRSLDAIEIPPGPSL